MILPAAAEAISGLDAFLGRVWSNTVVFFPVRHHSPACAYHLGKLIREKKPVSIMIEGPHTFDPLIPHMVDSRTRAPIAVFSLYARKSVKRGPDLRSGERHGSFYPLCDYSPEMVALREGHAIGSRMSFIDLDFPRQVVAEHREERARQSLTSLLDDSHLLYNRYLQDLAKRRGCRDAHELWDRLFENNYRSKSTEGFVSGVAGYCWFARANSDPERLERDATLDQEQHMWECVSREQRRLKRAGREGLLVVVTGGFHTPALALGWPAKWKRSPVSLGEEKSEVIEALIPYGFEQLDSLNGYGAGMPSPGYYQRLWSVAEEGSLEPCEVVASEILTEIARRLRDKNSALHLSSADCIAALAQSRLLAQVRGNAGPLREDLLDGLRSSFVKGELDIEGRLLEELALELMRGDSVGALPSGVPLHPIVADFRRQAKVLGLDLESTVVREHALEVYRKSRHQQVSLLFHRLSFLGVPYARFVSGPNFVDGKDLDLQVEHWSASWSPQTESALIEKSVHGSTVEEACHSRLVKHLEALVKEGSQQGALEAVRTLALALRLGLGDELDDFFDGARTKMAVEPKFSECVDALAQLAAMLKFRALVRLSRHPVLERLGAGACQRACFLLIESKQYPEQEIGAVLSGVSILRDLALEGYDPEPGWLDSSLILDAFQRCLLNTEINAELQGALVGALYSAGSMPAHDMEAYVIAGLKGRGTRGSTAPGFLLGLFSLCREISWQNQAIMTAIDETIAAWDSQEFSEALPHLRLAFSGHTPRETDKVAESLKQLHGGVESIDWLQQDFDEDFVSANVVLSASVEACLKEDRLDNFLED